MEMTINNQPMVGQEVGNVTKVLNLLQSGESVLVKTTQLDFMFINQNYQNEMLICNLESPGFTGEDINFNILDFTFGDLDVQSISIIEKIDMNLKTRKIR